MKSIALRLAICGLLVATLACNISTPQGPPGPTPKVVTIVATATLPQPAEVPTENAPVDQPSPVPSPFGESSGSGSSSESGGESFSVTDTGDIITSVSIKNGDVSFKGEVSYPGNDSSNNISVKPVDFDSTKTSGYLIFTLTCSGQGTAKVNYKGGLVESGSPGCGDTWRVYVVNGSPDSHITIHLDANGKVNWSLSITSGE